MSISPEEVGGLLGTIFVGTGMLVLVKAWARRIENKSRQAPSVPGETTQRMERMERAIDAVALEVERISESQRFLTKLLADRAEGGARGTLPRPAESRENGP
jgi:hypothetical protein